MSNGDERWKPPNPLLPPPPVQRREGPEYKPPVGPYELFQRMGDFVKRTEEKREVQRLIRQAQAFPEYYPEISGAKISPAWEEVLRWHRKIEPSENFQRLSFREKNEWRAKFFHKIVKPLLQPKEVEVYARYFSPDAWESFGRGLADPYVSMSKDFLLPPQFEPDVPASRMAGHIIGALPKYWLAGKAVSFSAPKKAIDVYTELKYLSKVPYWLRAATPGAHMARTTAQFLLADELPKIAMGQIDIEDIMATSLIGAAFGWPVASPLMAGGVAGAIYGPEEGIKMAALGTAMHSVGAIPRHISKTRLALANKLALKAELGRYQETIGEIQPREAPHLPSAKKALDDIMTERAERARTAVRKVDRLVHDAEQNAERLGIAADGLSRLRTIKEEVKILADKGPEVAFEERLGDFFNELEAMNEHLQMKFTRGLEDAEIHLTPQADQAIMQHPDTPTSRVLQTLKDRRIRVNSDVYRTLDDVLGPGRVSELDRYLAKQAAGRGRPLSLEQLQSYGVTQEELPGVIRAARERNLFAIEPVQVAEPMSREVAIESVYLERVSYLPRAMTSEYIKEAKDLAARTADLPLKTQRKLWLDFDNRLSRDIVTHWKQFLGEKKMELDQELDKIGKGEIEPSEAKLFGIPEATYVKYQNLILEWQQRLAAGEKLEVIMDEIMAEKIPLELLPEELQVRRMTVEESDRALSRARVEADRLYAEELEALQESRPMTPEEMAAAVEAGVFPREVISQFTHKGETPTSEVPTEFAMKGVFEPTKPTREARAQKFKFEFSIPDTLAHFKRKGRLSSLQLIMDGERNIKEVNIIHHRRYNPGALRDEEIFTGADVVQKLWTKEHGYSRGVSKTDADVVKAILEEPGVSLTPAEWPPPVETAIPEGVDILHLIELLERKNVRAQWNSTNRVLTIEGKPTTLEQLERLPEAGDLTTKGLTAITVQGMEGQVVLKMGDKWSIEEYPKVTSKKDLSARMRENLKRIPEKEKGDYVYKPTAQGRELLEELKTPAGTRKVAQKYNLSKDKAGAIEDALDWLETGDFPTFEDVIKARKLLISRGEFYGPRGSKHARKLASEDIAETRWALEWLLKRGLLTDPLKADQLLMPKPLELEDVLDLMLTRGYSVERMPGGSWRIFDLNSKKYLDLEGRELLEYLKKPPKPIPDLTPGIEARLVPESFRTPAKPPTDAPLRYAAKMTGRWIMPRKDRFGMYEKLYKVPVGTLVYDSKTGADPAAMRIRRWYRDTAVRAQNIVKAVLPSRQWAVMEYVFTADEPLAKAQAGERLKLTTIERQAAKEIENLSLEAIGKGYRELFDQAHDYLMMGEKGVEIKTWMEKFGWRPEYRLDMKNYLRNLLATRVRKAWAPYAEQLTQEIKNIQNRTDISTKTKRAMQGDIRSYRDRATAGLLGDHQVVSDAVRAINKHLGLNLEGTILDKIIGEYLLLSYASTMPLRLGLVLRNLFQPALTTGLYLGPRYLAEGYKRAFTPEGWELYAELNPRDKSIVAFQEHMAGQTPLEEVPSHLRPKGIHRRMARGAIRAGGKLERATGAVYRGGMVPYLGADKLNVCVSANAGYVAVKKLGTKMLNGEITYREFMIRSGLIYMQEAAQNEIMAALEGGNIEGAAKRAGWHMAENTQWIYRAANAPWIFEKMGRWGRLAGQFGVWPASYVQFVKRGVFTGDAAASGKFLLRWTLANSAMYLVGKEVFGVDLRMWIATGPLTYSGGPFIQLGQAASQMASSLFRAEWEKDVAEREFREAILTTVPLRSLVRDWSRAMSEEEPEEAIKRVLGLRTYPPPRRRRR